MTDGQLRVLALVLLLISLEVWLHWPAVRAWLHPIVAQAGGGTVPVPGSWTVPAAPGVIA